ncbi:MAG: PTS sugar transporter subunit IIA [Candidatus Fermentibacter sp.]|nr:PTS sugar transporter subunit IIA [Candidatus Fermentibacter sp.]
MKLSDCLASDHILTGLEASSSEEAIRSMVTRLFPNGAGSKAGIPCKTILDSLLDRERQHTTALGKGVACPHTRIAGFEGFTVAIGISRDGIPFESHDGDLVHIVILLISSLSKPYVQLRAMRVLIQFLEKDDNIDFMRNASPQEIWEAIDRSGLEISDQVFAHDLMRRVKVTASPGMSIGEAAHLMHSNDLSNLPVIDGNGDYKGFISSVHLFRVGVPQFFQNLKTVSFVRNLDPFEKYFASRHTIKVSDIQESGGSIDRDSTLIEVVFQMAVKGYSEIYVLDGSKLLGVIDNFRLIDRVLTL